MRKEEFRYNGLEILCNRLIFVIGLCVVFLGIVGFLGKAPINIISTINVCLIAIVNLLYGFVFKRKNIKIWESSSCSSYYERKILFTNRLYMYGNRRIYNWLCIYRRIFRNESWICWWNWDNKKNDRRNLRQRWIWKSIKMDKGKMQRGIW